MAIVLLLSVLVQAQNYSELNTFSIKGKNFPSMNKTNESELLYREGKGCLTHMWFGGSWDNWHKTRILIYVDGETQ